jgi:hypothetical protein
MPDFRIPKLCHHKASDRAIVRLGGIDHYLGPWGSAAARSEYDRLIAEWLVAGRQRQVTPPKGRLVCEILAQFMDHALNYYRHPDGSSTREINCFRDALKPLRKLYGHTPAAEFGPLALKALIPTSCDTARQLTASAVSRLSRARCAISSAPGWRMSVG